MVTAQAYPQISSDKAIQARYVRMRDEGQSHMMAEMLAFQQPPGSANSDRAFQEGRGNGEAIGEMTPRLRKKLEVKYRRLTGKSLPGGAQYMSQAAREPMDPRAVVETVGDVQRLNEQRRIEALEFKPSDLKKKKLGGHVLQKHMARELKRPENIGKSPAEIREKIIDKHGYNAHDTSDK